MLRILKPQLVGSFRAKFQFIDANIATACQLSKPSSPIFLDAIRAINAFSNHPKKKNVINILLIIFAKKIRLC